MQLIRSMQDAWEYIRAKRRKRERIIITPKGAGAATYKPRHPQGFANFRAALRGVGDWGRASERLDALEDALRRRHACGLPLPKEVTQNEDRSLSVFWEGASVRCFPDGFVSLIGGTKGKPCRTVTTDLLDLLGFLARLQAQ
jgi:hypothetical protein